MRVRSLFAASVVWVLGGAGSLTAQEVLSRQIIEKNGVKYESEMVRVPKTEITYSERTETVYVDRYVSEMQDSYRTVYVPVTEVVYEPRLHNWWNPFQPAHVAYHAVPRTRWETRTEVVRAPISRHEVVPQERIVREPIRTLKMVEQERITPLDEVPQQLASESFRPAARTALGPQRIGGVAQLEGDLPRQSTTSSRR